MIKTAILTVSSTRTEKNDESGKVLKEILTDDFEIIEYDIVSDNENSIIEQLNFYCDSQKPI